MIKKYNNISLAIGIPGIIVQAYGAMIESTPVLVTGAALLLVAFYFYTKAKAIHPAFCLLGLLSILGLIVLSVIRDKSGSDEVAPEKRNSKGFLIFIAVLIVLIIVLSNIL
ncbi:MAG: hypothetical protein B1H09_00745 [Gemmatimonadaceae bacterium 4484_173]|nr:MAG: hypothetical protein B1H09_00745 [Gemmatimonadaceae bacterium 4484_173]RKZ04276.1 MAG: hypothetical protein DRQ21_03280 [Candidatus Fermentibacteria bacterium]